MKKIINIVYSPQKLDQHKVYENKDGEIWRGGKYDNSKINIGMGWYSLRDPSPKDSLLVIEPYCVLPRDYRPDFVKQFHFVFTWAVKGFHSKLKSKIIEINHPSCHDLINKKIVDKDWLPWKERNDEIVFIANNKTSTHYSELYSLRIKLADYLHEHSKFKVSWYGQIPLNKPYFKGQIKSKQEILRQAKFSICCENSYDKDYTFNYFTEKMPEVWGAGTVPIYMGCYNIDRFGFHNQSYIDLRKIVFINKEEEAENKGKYNIDFNKLLNILDSYSEQQYNGFANILRTRILTPNKLFNQISYTRMYDTIIDAFAKSPPI